MVDQVETIDIQVRESGTDAVTASLQRLGLTGEQAAARVATGYQRINTSAEGATANQIILNRAAKDGTVDMAALATALDTMTNAELRAAERAGAFAAAQNTANVATKEGATVAAAHGRQVESLAGKYKALGGVLAGVAGYLGLHEFIEVSDEFLTIKNRLTAVIDAGDEGFTTFNKLGTQVISLGKSTSVLSESALSLNSALKLPDAAEGLRNAQASLDAFDNGINTAANSVAKANEANAKLNAQTRALGGSLNDAAGNSDAFWHSIDQASLSTAGVIDKESERLALVRNVRLAMVEATKEQERNAASQRDLASASDEVKEAYAGLLQSALKNGTNLEKSVELYGRLSAGAKEAGISTEELTRVTSLVGEQLRRFGITGRQATASMNELAEGFSTGEIKGKQLQAIIREFPQLLQPVADKLTGGSLRRLEEQFKSTGISAKEFSEAYIASGDRIDAASAKVQLTVGGALETVRTRLINYIGTSQQAGVAGDFLANSIVKFGEALPVVIPLVTGLGIAIAALKFAELIASVTTAIGLFTPFGAVVAAFVAIFGTMIASYTDYLVKSGQAADTTSALKLEFTQLQAFFAPFGAALSQISGGFAEIGRQLGVVTASSQTTKSEFGQLGADIASVGSSISTFVRLTLLGLDVVVVAVQNAIIAWDNLKLAIAGAQTRGSYVPLPDPTKFGFKGDGTFDSIDRTNVETSNSNAGPRVTFEGKSVLDFRDGGLIYARDGADVGTGFRVPGADRPDTVPLAMMVSRGERVIVQTEDQQAKHNAIMNAFRNGGIAMPHFASGGFIQANSNSTLGYQGADLTKTTYQTPVETPASTVSPSGSKEAVKQTTQNSNANAWAYQSEYGSDDYVADQKALKAGLFPYPGLYDNSQKGRGHYYTNGSDPYVYNFDGSKPTSQNIAVGPAGERIGYTFKDGVPYFPLNGTAEQWFEKLNYGRPPKSLAENGASGFHYARDGAVIYARDGADFTVPGAGPVDSRLVQMAVSPGERVRVDTADADAKASTVGRPRPTPAIAVTIMANDPGQFGRSKRQIADTLAKTVRRSPN